MSKNNSELLKALSNYQTKVINDVSTSSNDGRFLKTALNKTYKLRFLWNPVGDFKLPFVMKYQHIHRDSESTSTKIITCPTSEYDLGKDGFKKCNICETASKHYREFKESGSSISKQIYDKFKRQFAGYALVYVENDPTNEENNGKILVWRFGVELSKFLKKSVFGIDTDTNTIIDDDTVVGAAAFNIDDGYTFILQVGSKKDGDKIWPTYTPSWSRKTSPIQGLNEKQISEAAEVLQWSKLIEKHNPDEITAFHNKFVVKTELPKSKKEDNAPWEDQEHDVPSDFTTIEEPAKQPRLPTKQVKQKPVVAKHQPEDDLDVEGLLANLDLN